MKIERGSSIKQVQIEFSNLYPYLKIEFYAVKHAEYKGSLKKDEFRSETALTELNPNLKSGEISPDSRMSVGTLESLFEERFGLHVQVFRKSGDQWLQTSATDHWTLEEQNVHGKEMDDLL